VQWNLINEIENAAGGYYHFIPPRRIQDITSSKPSKMMPTRQQQQQQREEEEEEEASIPSNINYCFVYRHGYCLFEQKIPLLLMIRLVPQ
jgi:hypothetical protein